MVMVMVMVMVMAMIYPEACIEVSCQALQHHLFVGVTFVCFLPQYSLIK
jgi:hypothetical protein